MSVRVLHVVGGMNAGGVETWLMHVLRRTDRRQVEMDFLVHTERSGLYDDEILGLGSRIFRCLCPRRPWRFARAFRRLVREHGPYDAIHSHVRHYSGFVLRLAHAARIPARIAHSHNDRTAAERSASLLRRAYLGLTRRWIRRHATAHLACSEAAGVSLFGRRWRTDPRARVLRYGIDLAAFATPVDRAAVRAELGLPQDAFVLGHVGRFFPQKNHRFLLEVAAEAARRDARVRLLLFGDGPLREEIESRIAAPDLAGRVTLLGVRRDVHRALAAVDVFVFPSLWEGLPLAVLEAQAAGLPCVLSERITEEATAIGSLIRRRRLDESAAAWANAVCDARTARIAREDALAVLAGSPFDIDQTPDVLAEIYGVS